MVLVFRGVKIYVVLIGKCNVDWPHNHWPNIISDLAASLSSKSLAVLIKKLVLASAVYCIWRERNSRVFRKEKLPEEVIIEKITNLVRFRLLSMKDIKRSPSDGWFLAQWNLP